MEVQLRMQTYRDDGRNLVEEYRFEKENGWHCGHWHRTPEAAARCLLEPEGRGVPGVMTRRDAPLADLEKGG